MATELSGSESGIEITDSTEISQRPPALPGAEAEAQQRPSEQASPPATEAAEQEEPRSCLKPEIQTNHHRVV